MSVPAGLCVGNDVVVRKILVADNVSLSPVATCAAAIMFAVVAKEQKIRFPGKILLIPMPFFRNITTTLSQSLWGISSRLK